MHRESDDVGKRLSTLSAQGVNIALAKSILVYTTFPAEFSAFRLIRERMNRKLNSEGEVYTWITASQNGSVELGISVNAIPNHKNVTGTISKVKKIVCDHGGLFNNWSLVIATYPELKA